MNVGCKKCEKRRWSRPGRRCDKAERTAIRGGNTEKVDNK
jgi:hypothetical protein